MLFLLGQDCVILPTVILRFTNFNKKFGRSGQQCDAYLSLHISLKLLQRSNFSAHLFATRLVRECLTTQLYGKILGYLYYHRQPKQGHRVPVNMFVCRNKLRKKRVCVDVNRCILDSKNLNKFLIKTNSPSSLTYPGVRIVQREMSYTNVDQPGKLTIFKVNTRK